MKAAQPLYTDSSLHHKSVLIAHRRYTKHRLRSQAQIKHDYVHAEVRARSQAAPLMLAGAFEAGFHTFLLNFGRLASLAGLLKPDWTISKPK